MRADRIGYSVLLLLLMSCLLSGPPSVADAWGNHPPAPEPSPRTTTASVTISSVQDGLTSAQQRFTHARDRAHEALAQCDYPAYQQAQADMQHLWAFEADVLHRVLSSVLVYTGSVYEWPTSAELDQARALRAEVDRLVEDALAASHALDLEFRASLDRCRSAPLPPALPRGPTSTSTPSPRTTTAAPHTTGITPSPAGHAGASPAPPQTLGTPTPLSPTDTNSSSNSDAQRSPSAPGDQDAGWDLGDWSNVSVHDETPTDTPSPSETNAPSAPPAGGKRHGYFGRHNRPDDANPHGGTGAGESSGPNSNQGQGPSEANPPPGNVDANATPSTEPDLNNCGPMQQSMYEHVKKTVDHDIQLYRNPQTQRFTFQFAGGTRFDICSEYFHFLVEEGFFPFNEDWAVDDCEHGFRSSLVRQGYKACPNFEAIMNEVRRGCNEQMRQRVHGMNAKYGQEIMEWYRLCPPVADAARTPPQGPQETGGSHPTTDDARMLRTDTSPRQVQPPAQDAQQPPTRDANPLPAKTPCDQWERDAAGVVAQVIEAQVGFVDMGEWDRDETRYNISWLGTSSFTPCSEFFNFLVEEGAFPFDEDKAVQECVTTMTQSIRSMLGRADCPNWEGIERQIRTACDQTMRTQVRTINAHKNELLAIHRKCQERDLAAYERRKRLRDQQRDGSGLPPTDAAPSAPPQSPPAAAPKDATPKPPKTETSPPSSNDTTPAPPPAKAMVRPAAACCEKCPATAFERFYVPITPETECQAGDTRRDDLSVEAGTCANPLPIDNPPHGPNTYGEMCCGHGKDQLLYQQANKGDTTTDAGAVLRTPCPTEVPPPCGSGQQQTLLETSLLTTGKGSDYRNWEPEKPVLQLGKEQLRPCSQAPFYVPKESATDVTMVATAIFTSIDHEYADDAERAAQTPGTSCASGAAHPPHRSRTARAIDQAGKAAALGLLTAQAKGEIKGLRATFDVTGREAQLNTAKLHLRARQHITQEYTDVTVPMPLTAPDTSNTTGAQ